MKIPIKVYFISFITLSVLFANPVAKPPQSVSISPSVVSHSHVLKRKVAISRFTNETNYGRSFLLDKDSNPIGKQCLDILTKKLLDTDKFILLERADLDKINAELGVKDIGSLKNAADYLIIGSITAFGRKTEGEVGIFTRSKKQTAFAKVTIRLVDVETGMIIYAEEGSGEAFTEQHTSGGLGPTADYDSTLNDKVLDAAITNLASKVIENLLEKPWKAYFLSYQEGAYMITGSRVQGLTIGDNLDICLQGRKVKNPQTGMDITLPSKLIGKVKIDGFAGDKANEVAVVSIISGDIPKSEEPSAYQKYFLQEQR